MNQAKLWHEIVKAVEGGNVSPHTLNLIQFKSRDREVFFHRTLGRAVVWGWCDDYIDDMKHIAAYESFAWFMDELETMPESPQIH